jgi:hypothetical protein
MRRIRDNVSGKPASISNFPFQQASPVGSASRYIMKVDFVVNTNDTH